MKPRYFSFLSILLLGYAIMGKSFAKIGLPPLYIGEVTLIFGLLYAVKSYNWQYVFSLKTIWVMSLFYFIGLSCTLPYIQKYNVDALRDAVIWGYSLFAIIIYIAIIENPSTLNTLLELFRKFVTILLITIPFIWLIITLYYGGISRQPSAESKQLIYMKPSDVMVHMAGITSFFILGFKRVNAVYIFLIIFNIILAAFASRAGMISYAASFLILLIFDRGNVIIKKFIIAFIIALFLFWATGISISTERREISFNQLKNNVVSAFISSGDDSLENTKMWRLLWWADIVDYTVFGDYFWRGKGFGINLANDDGYQVLMEDESLRSPHNGHLNFLAREGVPGFIVWILLQLSWAAAIIISHFKSKGRGHEQWSRLFIFLLAYWSAFMVNASFDVYLEGPVGGAWFWTVFGVGLGAVYTYKYRVINPNEKGSSAQCNTLT